MPQILMMIFILFSIAILSIIIPVGIFFLWIFSPILALLLLDEDER